MLMCWNGDPEKRLSFSALQMDLDDFGPALVEAKYDYSAQGYMKEHGMTDKVERQGRGKRQKAREERLVERRRVTRK